MRFVNITTEQYDLAMLPSVRMITCAFCSLQRWEHDDLRAPFWRWYWNDRTGASVKIDKSIVTLGPNRVVLIPPNTPFSTMAARPVEHLFFHFWLAITRSNRAEKVIVRRPDRAEIADIRDMTVRMRSNTAGHDIGLRAQALAARAVAQLPASDWIDSTVDHEIDRVLQRLHDDAQKTPDNKDLAADAGISVNTLLRRFQAVVGTSPHQYALRLRIERACDLLRNGDLTIDQIALQTGFCDRFHLTRVFKMHRNMGPASFRKQHRAVGPNPPANHRS